MLEYLNIIQLNLRNWEVCDFPYLKKHSENLKSVLLSSSDIMHLDICEMYTGRKGWPQKIQVSDRLAQIIETARLLKQN